MANTRYAYVRDFELPDPLLPGVFMLLRLDGHSFHRFSDKHEFIKPNDVRALKLMDHAAKDIMEEYPDIVLAFGESDEYSFLLRKATTLYNRRQSKIVSTLTSYFTSCYVFRWLHYFPDVPLQYPPSFDGRIVLYPTQKHIRDYFAWRQADTHINNLYNTTFWALVQQEGQTTAEAHATLKGTYSKDKHELLFSRFGINYNKLDAQFRKGSVLVRTEIQLEDQADHTLDFGTQNAPDGSRRTPHSAERIAEIDLDVAAVPVTDALIAIASVSSAGETLLKSGGRQDNPPSLINAEELNEASPMTIASVPKPSSPMPMEGKKEKKAKSKKAQRQQHQKKAKIEVLHCDIIGNEFWDGRPEILEGDK